MHESLIKYINSYATTQLTESEIEMSKNSFVTLVIVNTAATAFFTFACI